ncbi:MAG: hypothetical protein WA639_06015 [Candidatus Acidiferrum sp.]
MNWLRRAIVPSPGIKEPEVGKPGALTFHGEEEPGPIEPTQKWESMEWPSMIELAQNASILADKELACDRYYKKQRKPP